MLSVDEKSQNQALDRTRPGQVGATVVFGGKPSFELGKRVEISSTPHTIPMVAGRVA